MFFTIAEVLYEHWIVVTLAFVVYLTFALTIAWKFQKEIIRLKPVSTYLKKHTAKEVLSHVLRRVFGLFLCIVAAPYFYAVIRDERREKKKAEEIEEAKRREERQRKWREEEEAKREAWEKERRRQLEWLKADPQTVYYHTICGITAVLTAPEYNECVKKTRRARRNGTWTSESVLMPSDRTCLFLHETGRQHLESREVRSQVGYGPLGPRPYVRCGWLTDLDDLAEELGFTLEPKDDIFVPFVNESLMSLKDQVGAVGYPNMDSRARLENSLLYLAPEPETSVA